jgi:hypothetical protein
LKVKLDISTCKNTTNGNKHKQQTGNNTPSTDTRKPEGTWNSRTTVSQSMSRELLFAPLLAVSVVSVVSVVARFCVPPPLIEQRTHSFLSLCPLTLGFGFCPSFTDTYLHKA